MEGGGGDSNGERKGRGKNATPKTKRKEEKEEGRKHPSPDCSMPTHVEYTCSRIAGKRAEKKVVVVLTSLSFYSVSLEQVGGIGR